MSIKGWIRTYYKAIKVDIRYYWRMLRSRCLICGDLRGHSTKYDTTHVDKCYHCRTNRSWCHWCNKRMNHAANYGIRKAKLINLIYSNGQNKTVRFR